MLLISGSGPTGRYECEPVLAKTKICVFYDFARAITDAGYAALVYDKRACDYVTGSQCAVPPQGSPKWCSSTFANCSPAALKQLKITEAECKARTSSPPCTDPHKISFNDFVADAVAGIRFLQARAEIQSDRISLLGHSQGCDVAPMAAAFAKTKSFQVESLILMNGAGVSIDKVLQEQSELKAVLATSSIYPIPRGTYNATSCAAAAEGALKREDITDATWTSVMSGDPNGFTPVLGIPTKNYYYQEWIRSGYPAQRRAYINASAVRAVFAYNSPADQLVPPASYEPLHELLNDISNPPTSSQGLSSALYGGGLTWPHSPTNLQVGIALVPGMRHVGWSIDGWGPKNRHGCKPPTEFTATVPYISGQADPLYLLPVCPGVTNTIRGFLHSLELSVPVPTAAPTTPPTSAPTSEAGSTNLTIVWVLLVFVCCVAVLCCISQCKSGGFLQQAFMSSNTDAVKTPLRPDGAATDYVALP